MLIDDKQRLLRDIKNEDELRKELVIPLLRKMPGYIDVLDNQGPNEVGVDVIASQRTSLGATEYTAFVLKHGDITQKVSEKTNLVRIIEDQITMALKHPLSHPRLPGDRGPVSRRWSKGSRTSERQ